MNLNFTRSRIFTVIALIIIDASSIQLALGLGSQVSIFLGILVIAIAVVLNVVFLLDRFYAWRWSAPGLALMALMVLYPVLSTVYVAFTNYSDGHSLTKEQALEQLTSDKDTAFYKPDNAISFKWYAFLSTTASNPATPDDYVFW